jgi:uncharacterized protein Veg
MTLYEVKKNLGEHIGHEVKIKYSLGRNKYENYHATIKELYDYVFTVENEQGIKSFSYSDVMIKTIRIDY